MMANVLITGIAGFLGSALARELCDQGAFVVGLVRSANDAGLEELADYKVYVGDICDGDLLAEIISRNEIDVIYHLAAYSIVRVSARDPYSTYRINVMGTVSLLEAARQVGRCSRIIVASSDKAYGDHEDLPYQETHPLLPKNTYDVSKACMDLIAQSYGTNYGMPVIVTRCSNIYGPGDRNVSRLIPGTILRVIDGERPVLYSDVEDMEREFIFIDDVVDAYVKLGEHDCPPGTTYNIGVAQAVKIRDVVKTICSIVGKDDLEPEIVQREPAFKEIQRQCISAGKLMADTGWHPEVKLEDGLRQTILYYLEQ